MPSINLSLSDAEALELKKVLRLYLSELRMEIADTDQMDYREELKQEEMTIKRLLELLDIGGSEKSAKVSTMTV
jgi:hypothetical protein